MSSNVHQTSDIKHLTSNDSSIFHLPSIPISHDDLLPLKIWKFQINIVPLHSRNIIVEYYAEFKSRF